MLRCLGASLRMSRHGGDRNQERIPHFSQLEQGMPYFLRAITQCALLLCPPSERQVVSVATLRSVAFRLSPFARIPLRPLALGSAAWRGGEMRKDFSGQRQSIRSTCGVVKCWSHYRL
eukprot:scaffold8507_cov277-Pinguiococcus_pyrenoidosus.AAC.1